MIRCSTCSAVLEDETPGIACPSCGGTGRQIFVEATGMYVIVDIHAPSVSVGYSDQPSWTEHWDDLQEAYLALKRIYALDNTLDNLQVRRVIKTFFTQCWHLSDWLKKDPESPVTEDSFRVFIPTATALQICHAVADISKHHAPSHGMTARVTRVNFGRTCTATIEYQNPDGEVDALQLADGCMTEWRDFMEAQGMEVP